MRLREQARTIDAFVGEYTDMGLERLDAEEASYDRLVEAVQSLPFLVPRKLVVIRSGSLNTEFTEKFESFLGAITESTDVLIVEGKLDKRTVYYKLLKKHTEFHDFSVLDANGLAQFAAQYAKEQGSTLSAGDARFLVERTGTNQMAIMHELDKLLTYDVNITRSTIALLTDEVPQSKIFDLLEAAFSGRADRTQALYADQRAQGVEPQQIVAMLVWQLYTLAVVKAGQQRPTAEIAAMAKINPYVVEKTRQLARRIPLVKLQQMIGSLRVLDVRSKSENIILDDAMRHYLLTLSI
jgi:DNA polymerase-3 subunit delta